MGSNLAVMKRPLISRRPDPEGPAGSVPAAPLGGGRGEAMRRLQIGASGLAAVLVLIGLASLVKDRASEADSTAVAGAAATTAPAPATDAADPLAEAGVVPEIPEAPTGTPAARPAPADGV